MRDSLLWFLLGFLWGAIVTIIVILIIVDDPSILGF